MFIALNYVCESCYGEGKIRDLDACDNISTISCRDCNGSGYVTTEFGDELLAFISNHREQIKDLLDIKIKVN